jgi:hypothetical protein
VSITLHDQFRRLRQGVVEAVNAQAGLTARPAGVEAPADDDPESLALVIDGIGMLITYKAEVHDRCAFVFTEFGRVTPEDELPALRRLLDINFLMYRGGAPAFTRDPDSGHILLLCEVPLDVATPTTVLAYLHQLSGHARQWRQGHYLQARGGPVAGVMPSMV